MDLPDANLLALTAMGEARGDRKEGMSSIEERLGCMMTIRNRLKRPKRFGEGYKGVCLKPKQYSCWNEGDPNRKYLLSLEDDDPLYVETLYLAEGVIEGVILDHTSGATHYYSPASMKPAGSVPYWAKGVRPCARIGGSLYFKGV